MDANGEKAYYDDVRVTGASSVVAVTFKAAGLVRRAGVAEMVRLFFPIRAGAVW